MGSSCSLERAGWYNLQVVFRGHRGMPYRSLDVKLRARYVGVTVEGMVEEEKEEP